LGEGHAATVPEGKGGGEGCLFTKGIPSAAGRKGKEKVKSLSAPSPEGGCIREARQSIADVRRRKGARRRGRKMGERKQTLQMAGYERTRVQRRGKGRGASPAHPLHFSRGKRSSKLESPRRRWPERRGGEGNRHRLAGMEFVSRRTAPGRGRGLLLIRRLQRRGGKREKTSGQFAAAT